MIFKIEKGGVMSIRRYGPAKTAGDEFLNQLAEAAYQVVSQFGFKGSFLSFLCFFKEALEEVMRRKEGLP